MRKIFYSLLLIASITTGANAQLKDLIGKGKDVLSGGKANTFSNADIGNALKEALNNGVTKQVTKLTAVDGFYKNEAVKILLPEELQSG